ncbi:MAG TPA: hypothetical protein VGB18_02360 [Candidatus Thermoplasmatota archaeon]
MSLPPPPPNLMKAGERPSKIRTGARTATKTQERDMLDKLGRLAEDFRPLIPEWLGPGRSPFDKHARKLAKIQTKREKPRRLRWAARGKRLWNGYAASMVVEQMQKIPSFAAMKFQGRDIKFVYRTGTGRQALIGVQHYDDPEVRLLGYTREVKAAKVYLVTGADRLVAHPPGAQAPLDLLVELFRDHDCPVLPDGRTLKCPHAEGSETRLAFRVHDIDADVELCTACLKDIKDSFTTFLEKRVLGPRDHLPVDRKLLGHLYTLRPDASVSLYEDLAQQAFREAQHHAKENFVSYSDVELLQWTRDKLLGLLDKRPEGYLLVADELWLADFEQAADAYVDSDLERRALKSAFRVRAPRLKTSDRSLTKILDPYWKEQAESILNELAGGLLKPQELAQLTRLTPSEAIAGLARILGVRERFKEYAQFSDLDPSLDFVVTCLQIQRSGEQRILVEKLHSGAREPERRALALALARCLGEQAAIEWQYAPHEKDSASFLEPYVRDVVSAPPAKLGETLGNLAVALNVPKPMPA